MGWSGSGTFTRTDGTRTGATVWETARLAGVKIRSDDHDTHDQDLADGINACLAKNGENAATGNLDLGSNKLTNVANGSTSTDAATYGQAAILAVANTFTQGQIIQASSASLSIIGTSDTALEGPVLFLQRDSASPADNDLVGSIIYQANSDGNDDLNGIRVAGKIIDATDSTFTLNYIIHTFYSGAYADRVTIGGGLMVGSPTNGDPGDGKLSTEGDINSGGGILFNGDTAAANTLDDYEEGSWTPDLTDGTTSATLSVAAGTYTKIGDTVILECHIVASSITSMTGTLKLDGMPFSTAATSNIVYPGFVGQVANANITAGYGITVEVGASNNRIRFYLNDSTGGTTGLDASEITSTFDISFSLIHRV